MKRRLIYLFQQLTRKKLKMPIYCPLPLERTRENNLGKLPYTSPSAATPINKASLTPTVYE